MQSLPREKLRELHFNKSEFEEKCEMITKATESLPAASRLRNSSQRQNLEQQFEEFHMSV